MLLIQLPMWVRVVYPILYNIAPAVNFLAKCIVRASLSERGAELVQHFLLLLNTTLSTIWLMQTGPLEHQSYGKTNVRVLSKQLRVTGNRPQSIANYKDKRTKKKQAYI